MNKKEKWTQEEDSIICSYYSTEGKKILQRLPGRTYSACRRRAMLFGVQQNKDVARPDTWSPEEDDIIRRYYPVEGAKAFERLPGRTRATCYMRAAKLGVRKPGWTPEEDDILRQFYPKEGAKIVDLLPGHSLLACQQRAHRLGVNICKRTAWTEEEDEILRRFYQKEKWAVADRLPGRTPRACALRASRLGI